MKDDLELWEIIFTRLRFIKDIEARVWITEMIYKLIRFVK